MVYKAAVAYLQNNGIFMITVISNVFSEQFFLQKTLRS